MAKLAKSKTATDDTPVAPKDIKGDVTQENILDEKESTSPRSKRKRAGEFFDFEEDEAELSGAGKKSESTVAQPKKKSRTASAAEKKAKPSKDNGETTSVADEKTKPSKDASKTTSAAKKKTKASKDDGKAESVTETKAKPSKDDRKTASAAEKKTKPSKDGGKTASAAEKKTKPSKEDGHPVVTEKTHPGGDMVETEPETKSEPQKKNERKTRKQDKAAEKAEKKAEKPDGKKESSKPKAGPAKAKETAGREEQASAEPKSQAKKAGTSKAGKKSTSRPDGDKAVSGPSTEKPPPQAQGVRSPKKSKDKVKDVDSKVESLQSKEAADVEAQNDPARKKAKASKPGKAAKDTKNAEAEASEPAPAAASDVAPQQSMDEAPFKKLVKRERAKIPAVKASAEAAEAERKAHDSSNADKPVDKGKKASKVEKPDSTASKPPEKAAADTNDAASSKTTEPKGKKRKDGPDAADTKTESPPSEKKQKKSRKSVLDVASTAVGELVHSGIEVAAHGVSAVKDLASGLGNKSIADDITAVAEGAVKEKSKKRQNGENEAGKKDEKPNKGKGKEKATDTGEPDEQMDIEESEDEDNFEEGDQTLALVKGFESEGDEAEPGEDGGFKEGMQVPQLPQNKDLTKKLKAAKDDESEGGPGVVYVGRIPHGFYEPQMRSYFSQFGHLSRLRLSRNRTTGASKHYAFLEFVSAAVAKIVAETMNNYLMFGHILKVRLVPGEQVHENLWKGAGKRFKKVPWARIEGRKLEKGVGRGQWEKRVEVERKRRGKKGERLREMGYEFEGPELKGVEDVKGKGKEEEAEKAIEGGEDVVEEKTLVTTDGKDGSVIISEEVKTKKTKKAGEKRKAADEKSEETAAPEVAKKVKKVKKSTA